MKKLPEHFSTSQKLFESYKVDKLKIAAKQLQKLMRQTGIGDSERREQSIPTRKAEVVSYLASCLEDAGVPQAVYARMNSLEQSAVREAIESPSGRLDKTRFSVKYGMLPAFSNSWEYFKFPHRRDEVEFAWLCLFMSNNGVMPDDLLEKLGAFVEPPKKTAVEYLESLPETRPMHRGKEEAQIVVHPTENAAIRDVVAVLRLLEKGKVSVGATTGKPSKAGAKAIRKVLSAGDFYPEDWEAPHRFDIQMGASGIRPFAWAMLAQASGLAQINGSKLALAAAGTRALKTKPQDILKRMWKRWLKSATVHEMSRIEAIKGQKSKGRPLAAAPPARRKIADTMADLEEGKWVEIESFCDYAIASGNDFTISRNPWKLYIGDPNYGSFGYGNVQWRHLEGRFAMAFLLEYAATLGLVDVALTPPWYARKDFGDLWGADEFSCLSRYDGLVALRLNSLGAWILGKKKKYEPIFRDDPCFQVLPNLEISSVGPATPPSDVLFLERFCEDVSEQVWRLSPGKVLECTENGVDIDEIRKFLEERNRGDLPGPVLDFLGDMKQRTGQIKDSGPARLMVCDSEAVARLIANDAKLKDLCMLAGDRHLAVLSENEARFKKALRALGYGMTSNA